MSSQKSGNSGSGNSGPRHLGNGRYADYVPGRGSVIRHGGSGGPYFTGFNAGQIEHADRMWQERNGGGKK